MNLFELNAYTEDRIRKKKYLKEELQKKEKEIVYKEEQVEVYTKARSLLTEASRLTQQKVKDKIESLLTVALQSIYGKDMKFIADFQIKRNKSEVEFKIQENEDVEPYLIKDDKGGGVWDVCGLALRMVMWSLQKPRTRPFFVLDEPGKWMGDLVEKYGEIMKQLCEDLGIRILMVTHDKRLIDIADKSWLVKNNGEYCEVVEQV